MCLLASKYNYLIPAISLVILFWLHPGYFIYHTTHTHTHTTINHYISFYYYHLLPLSVQVHVQYCFLDYYCSISASLYHRTPLPILLFLYFSNLSSLIFSCLGVINCTILWINLVQRGIFDL